MKNYTKNTSPILTEMQLLHFACNISNTRDRVSSGYPNTDKRVENTTRSEIRGVSIADETLFQVFDVSPQSKQKLRRKWRSKIVKIYAN